MRKLLDFMRKLVLDYAYCPYCKDYVKVESIIERRNEVEIEVKKCIKCGNIVEQVVRHIEKK